MSHRKEIFDLVYCAIDDVNRMLAKEQRLVKSPDSIIMGRMGKLDSLGVVNLIVAVESRVAEEFGISVNLADTAAPSGNSPLRTIGSLADYLITLMNEKVEKQDRVIS